MTFSPDELRSIIDAIEDSGWEEARLVTPDVTLVLSKSGDPTLLGDASAPTPGGSTATREAMTPAAPAGDPQPSADPAALAPPAGSADAAASPGRAPAGEVPDDAVVITAPSLGIFWRSPKPGAPPFVEVGDTVTPDTTVCIVEVMKLMNHVKAGTAGTVAAIHVGNSEMVEHGQALVSVAAEQG